MNSPSEFKKNGSLPTSIGPYKVESLLDRRGTSLFYLGTHPATKEPVAIKVLSPDYLSDETAVDRFINEAEIISLTQHPNIVKLFGYGRWEGGLYIAMEFVEGVSLRQYLLKNPISLRRALEVIVEIAYALCHLHAHGVIHRDLKPENILIDAHGVIKVIDFGIAQLLTSSLTNSTEAMRLVGTPVYMSPEQKSNPSAVSYPSDIYSLGIITYELILGRLSLGHVHLTLMPKGIKKILSKALQPNQEDRYQDIVDFIADVTNYLHSEELERERVPGGQVSELSEELEEIFNRLLPPIPEEPEREWGILTQQRGIHVGGFYDIYQEKEETIVIWGQVQVSGAAERLISTVALRSYCKASYQHSISPETFFETLQKNILKEKLLFPIELSFLRLRYHDKRYSLIHTGKGGVYKISKTSRKFVKISPTSKAFYPEIHFRPSAIEGSFSDGDTLLIICNLLQLTENEIDTSFIDKEWWSESFIDQEQLSLQKKIELAWRRGHARIGEEWQQMIFTIIATRNIIS